MGAEPGKIDIVTDRDEDGGVSVVATWKKPMLPTQRPPETRKAELRSGGVLEDQEFPPSSAGPSLRVRAQKGAGPEWPPGGRVRRAASMAQAPISTPMKTAKIPTVNQLPCPKIINPTPARHRPFAAMSRYKGPRRYSMHLR